MAQQESSSSLPKPLRPAAAALRKVPGAGLVGRAAEGTLDRIGAVSPRGRRMVVYAGAGVLGVVGVVEWPVALTGAAVVWLTQPRPGDQDGEDEGARSADTAEKEPAAELEAPDKDKASGGHKASGKAKKSSGGGKPAGKAKSSGGGKAPAGRASSGGKKAKTKAASTNRPGVTARLRPEG
ncbi:hypothetical protein GCM10010145_20830 [Streptomyces ruber]|uniref:Uncharacterized protein n=2 Tax=Streptomyces TaxID=1883 RepID=A0A918BA41_9ACTN|nr:hypothetical protein [Streptomyces ruber]GGQ51409.1 hypothetical protein GCM10010145_20830 [Streptomyces ruber]